jgi:DNA-binding beta-propeller fold protein YncE
MKTTRAALFAAIVTTALVLTPAAAFAGGGGGHGHGDPDQPVAELLTDTLQAPIGSTIGPDGALYVADTPTGNIVRVDTETGETSAYATGLPTSDAGGPFDVTFVDDTAYVLVTLVGADVGGTGTGGIYRVDSPTSHTLVADLATWSTEHPPTTDFFVPSGLQYAFAPVERGDGFLVTDGHHNRLLFASMDGDVQQVAQFDNIVPTGLEVDRRRVYLAEAGPVPHDPSTGRVVALDRRDEEPRVVASGYSLVVDVQSAGCRLYALSQGAYEPGAPEGAPAAPDTGDLLKVNRDGTFTALIENLNLPTSLSFDDDAGYIVSLAGSVWRVEDLADGHHRGGACSWRG